MFRAYHVERNKKWAKYLIQNVLKRIMILERLKNITTDMAEQEFEMLCDIKPE